MLSKNILLTTIAIVMMYAPAAFSQKAPGSDFTEQRSSLSIHEDNLYCFQNVRCLQAEKPFKKADLSNIRLNGSVETYVIQGKTKNEELYAEYNGSNGNLVKATVVQRNIVLPKEILISLATGETNGWTMVGNKRTITNFQKDSIQYEVMLLKDGELRVEYFDRNGQSEEPFS